MIAGRGRRHRRNLAVAAAEEEQARATAGRAEIALQALEDEERSLAEQETLPVEGVIATLRGDLQALEAAAGRDGREMTAASIDSKSSPIPSIGIALRSRN